MYCAACGIGSHVIKEPYMHCDGCGAVLISMFRLTPEFDQW